MRELRVQSGGRPLRVFYAFDPRRSAILLIGVHGRESVVYGILHPEAAYPFNQGFLPEVPFIRIAKWPIVDGKIWTEWVIANPPGKSVPHWKISLPRPKRKRVDPRETVSVDE